MAPVENMQLPPETPLNRRPRAVIVGASSGIGAALARRLAQEGMSLALLARREAALEDLCAEINQQAGETRALAYPHDVTQSESIPPLFERLLADLGGIDLFVYCAGFQYSPAIDEYDFAQDRQTLEVNLLAAVAWLGLVANLFQRMRHGSIVGITSLAGDRGRVANPPYSSSKAGLDAYLESLRNRLTRHGVHVLTVKPGFVDTEILKNAASKTFGVISPTRAADGIWMALRKKHQLVYLPWWWRLIMLAIRFTPSFIFRRLSF
ncbi:MAG: SDR family NAD(P)-dependent oxidoreductase [Chloroflexi bacterium]|nr:SDR family NAD(P)-dependent oxidoreductase [Chloroflexota bacterium]MQC26375.1 SDR family NAD(P)-dependent oxidoreductase [Chloroflexota bacterium]